MTKEMTEGSPLRLIFNFSLPLILGSLLQQTYSLIDAAIVGKYLGINDLAAVGASTSVVFLIIGFCTGCCCGFGIPVAQAFGARSYSDLRRYVANSLWVSLIISVVLAVVTSLLCERILFMMQTPHDILHHAYLYLLVTFIGIPFTFLYNLLSSLIRALGDSKTRFISSSWPPSSTSYWICFASSYYIGAWPEPPSPRSSRKPSLPCFACIICSGNSTS